jgi:hypothetical protein
MLPLLKDTLPLDDLRMQWTADARPDLLQFVGPTRETDRMTAQQTLVSVSRGVLADHGVIIDNATDQQQDPGKPIHFCKVVIPRQSKLPFLRRLHQMNITASSLFPGIDGLGRSLLGAGEDRDIGCESGWRQGS